MGLGTETFPPRSTWSRSGPKWTNTVSTAPVEVPGPGHIANRHAVLRGRDPAVAGGNKINTAVNFSLPDFCYRPSATARRGWGGACYRRAPTAGGRRLRGVAVGEGGGQDVVLAQAAHDAVGAAARAQQRACDARRHLLAAGGDDRHPRPQRVAARRVAVVLRRVEHELEPG
eukprot:scaffold59789_cov70-Phaeocystis_antarctica.AAC.2